MFIEKHLCWSLFLMTLQAYLQENILKVYNFIEKRLQHMCFPVNIVKFLKIAFFIEHLWWLLLKNGKLVRMD